MCYYQLRLMTESLNYQRELKSTLPHSLGLESLAISCQDLVGNFINITYL